MTYTNIPYNLIGSSGVPENQGKLLLWVIMKRCIQEKFHTPSLAYDFQYEVIKIAWDKKKEIVFRSIAEERFLRDRL